MEKNGCTDVIVERNYIDKEYLDEFSFFYSTSFKNYDRFCTRLHFFNDNLNKELEINFNEEFTLTGSQKDVLQKRYLGFCVIRPTEKYRVSRSIIKPYIENPRDIFIISQSTYRVNLNGTCLSISGMPFMQQDSQSGVCASADLMMLSAFMHEVYRHRLCTSPEISLIANKFLGSDRSFPNRGLTVSHMMSALSEMGYSPVVYSRQNASVPLNEIAYYYLESALPVLLFWRGHVCLAIGHDFTPNLAPMTPGRRISRNYDFIRHFIIHDDELGPYLLMPLKKSDVKNAHFFPNLDADVFRSSYTHPLSFEDIVALIVPVHKKIYISGEELNSHIEALLDDNNHIYKLITAKMGGSEKIFLEDLLKNNNLALRTYFMKSNDYKKWVAELPSMSEEVKTFYLNSELPKFIWVTEITDLENLRKSANKDHFIMGEIISDTTASSKSPFQFLYIHLPSVLIEREPNNRDKPDKISIYSVQDDRPYGAFINER